jgi:hypothetical protein
MTTRHDNVRNPEVHNQLSLAAVRSIIVNDRMNQMLIEHLDPAAWNGS